MLSSYSIQTHRRRCGRAGFSLVEILVVVGIIAAAALAVVPSWRGTVGQVRSDAVREGLIDRMNYARTHAILQGQVVRLRYDPSAQVLDWSVSAEDDAGADLAALDFRRWDSLPGRSIRLPHEWQLRSVNEDMYFLPSGRIDGEAWELCVDDAGEAAGETPGCWSLRIGSGFSAMTWEPVNDTLLSI